MKLKSLILGSVAAAGLSTAGFAADLGVLTSLDTCDALAITGLTISSGTNCLAISGGVSYSFEWGDYKGKQGVTTTSADDFAAGALQGPIDNDGVAGLEMDWESQVEAWLKFVGTSSTDIGKAQAIIKLKSVNETRVQNEVEISSDDDTGASPDPVTDINADKGLWIADEAYVQVGDTTILMAGKKSSIANFGDDEPFNFTGLFNANEVDTGVLFVKDNPRNGGVAIQVVSNLGNGVNVGLGIERLERSDAQAGTIVGVIGYAGETITAHLTGLAGGALDGTIDDYAMHAGFTGTFDAFRVRAALAASTDTATNDSFWNGLVSAQATFDMFKVAVSAEATGGTGLDTDFGFGGSIGATVTDGVEINLGGKYYNDGLAGAPDGYHIAAQLVAAVTETIKITGEIGVWGNNAPVAVSDFYGAAELGWTPDTTKGGFTSSIRGEAHQNGAYKVTFKAAKSFE